MTSQPVQASVSPPLRYFYDFEFYEDGRVIDPLSVGVVCEDGREFYAVNRSADWARAFRHSWLRENVLPYMPLVNQTDFTQFLTGSPLDVSDPAVRYKSVLADDLHAFFLADGRGSSRDVRALYAWYASYDHVALAQLWGPMIELPDGVPMYTNDIKSYAARLGNPALPTQEVKEHHALEDARWNRAVFEFLERVEVTLIAEASMRVACCPMDKDTVAELLDVLRSSRAN